MKKLFTLIIMATTITACNKADDAETLYDANGNPLTTLKVISKEGWDIYNMTACKLDPDSRKFIKIITLGDLVDGNPTEEKTLPSDVDTIIYLIGDDEDGTKCLHSIKSPPTNENAAFPIIKNKRNVIDLFVNGKGIKLRGVNYEIPSGTSQ
jgi:hypothetical protein